MIRFYLNLQGHKTPGDLQFGSAEPRPGVLPATPVHSRGQRSGELGSQKTSHLCCTFLWTMTAPHHHICPPQVKVISCPLPAIYSSMNSLLLLNVLLTGCPSCSSYSESGTFRAGEIQMRELLCCGSGGDEHAGGHPRHRAGAQCQVLPGLHLRAVRQGAAQQPFQIPNFKTSAPYSPLRVFETTSVSQIVYIKLCHHDQHLSTKLRKMVPESGASSDMSCLILASNPLGARRYIQ